VLGTTVPSFVGYRRVVKGEKAGVKVDAQDVHTALGVPPKFSEGTAELRERVAHVAAKDSEAGRASPR
jgi:hypothetical protein